MGTNKHYLIHLLLAALNTVKIHRKPKETLAKGGSHSTPVIGPKSRTETQHQASRREMV